MKLSLMKIGGMFGVKFNMKMSDSIWNVSSLSENKINKIY